MVDNNGRVSAAELAEYIKKLKCEYRVTDDGEIVPVETHTPPVSDASADSHKKFTLDYIDEMRAVFGDEAVRHFCLCNVWKYRYRANFKTGRAAEKALAKADTYMRYYCALVNWNKTPLREMAEHEAVVRCRDCKYWRQLDELEIGICSAIKDQFEPDHYCAWGERR